jgi:hypothetical protein
VDPVTPTVAPISPVAAVVPSAPMAPAPAIVPTAKGAPPPVNAPPAPARSQSGKKPGRIF